MTISRELIVAGLLATSLGALAQTDRSALASVPVEELKGAYLRCDQLSSRSVLDRGSAIHCSMVAEELCQRGFGGSFGHMIAWWQGARLDAAGVAARGKRPAQRSP